MRPRITTILPCNDLDSAEKFFSRLGFFRRPGDKDRYPPDAEDDYRILIDKSGADIHLNQAVEGWVVAEKNPFGLYVYRSTKDDVDALAVEFQDEIIEEGKRAETKGWGMYEFSLNGPDGVLVRVGCSASEVKDGSESKGCGLGRNGLN
ncbi:hypothetical protein EJ08DRAFT_650225 [Tothia fuscella]|uniref:Glyoxalase n=1 Tax=Tothia fuscella TaxID=1048955 RepID=A0A9P4TYD5_9PEZI|nr:hypothetical protein EJ08DRAFT_650225 [Tothia fuscella]